MSDSSFFNKLAPNTTQDILEFSFRSQINLVLKIHDRHFKTRILTKKNDREFSVYKFNFVEYQNEDVICSFDVRNDKYFFKALLKATDSDFIISIPADVYQLQRRNDFRITITPSISYSCEVRLINFKKLTAKAELVDLSLGGCLISLKNADKFEVPKDGEVEISLKINDFENQSIVTIAKHVRMIGSNNSLQLGLQYVDPSANFLSELQTLLIQLDRIQRGKTLD